MANPHRGEVAFDHDGKTYKLSFSTNALCELEDALDTGVAQIAAIMSDPARMRIKTARAVFWAGLTDHHDGIDIKAAGEIISALGMQRAIELIGEAFALAFPTARGGDELATQFGGQAEAMANTTKGKLTQAFNALGDAMEKVGEVIAPFIIPLAEGIKSAAEAFQQLTPETRTMIVIFAGLAAAIGPLLLVLGLMASAIAAIGIPVAAAVAAIGLLTATVVAFWDKIRALADYIMGGFTSAINWFRGLFGEGMAAQIRARTTDLREWAAAARGVSEAARSMMAFETTVTPAAPGLVIDPTEDEAARIERENMARRMRNLIEAVTIG